MILDLRIPKETTCALPGLSGEMVEKLTKSAQASRMIPGEIPAAAIMRMHRRRGEKLG